jgi:hypothetical protein
MKALLEIGKIRHDGEVLEDVPIVGALSRRRLVRRQLKGQVINAEQYGVTTQQE